MVGQLCGEYRLIEHIFSGSGSRVYLAEHGESGDEAAVSVFARVDEAAVDGSVERLRAIARLDHPEIATIHEVGRLETGEVFIAAELIDGDPVEGPLDIEACAWRARQVAGALAEIHELGACHGSLAPSCVYETGVNEILIADCGVAPLIGAETSPAGDVAALAELLASMLEPDAALPGRLSKLLDAMLAIEPLERPSMNEVETALELVIGELPQDFEPPTVADPPTMAPPLFAELEPTVLETGEPTSSPPPPAPPLAPPPRKPAPETIEPLHEPHTEEDLPDLPDEVESLSEMIEREALGDDAPTMVIPQEIDPALLDEQTIPLTPPVRSPPIASPIPPAANLDTDISAGLPWRWIVGIAAAIAVLIIFLIARG